MLVVLCKRQKGIHTHTHTHTRLAMSRQTVCFCNTLVSWRRFGIPLARPANACRVVDKTLPAHVASHARASVRVPRRVHEHLHAMHFSLVAGASQTRGSPWCSQPFTTPHCVPFFLTAEPRTPTNLFVGTPWFRCLTSTLHMAAPLLARSIRSDCLYHRHAPARS